MLGADDIMLEGVRLIPRKGDDPPSTFREAPKLSAPRRILDGLPLGLAGDDCIDLGPGTDNGDGGAGADLIVGGPGSDRMSGSRGNDRLLGGSAADRFVGGPGNDRISGGPGSDTVVADRADRVARNCERIRRL